MMSNRFHTSVQHGNFKYGTVVGLLLSIGALAACQTQQQIVSAHEDNLARPGSSSVLPIPPNGKRCCIACRRTYLQRVNGDAVHYVYADPLVLWLPLCRNTAGI